MLTFITKEGCSNQGCETEPKLLISLTTDQKHVVVKTITVVVVSLVLGHIKPISYQKI